MDTALLISDTQKDVLQKAVDTGNAKFIAQCIVNIEEIIECIKNILSFNDVSLTPASEAGRGAYNNPADIGYTAPADSELDIKEEPVQPESATAASPQRIEPADNSSSVDDHVNSRTRSRRSSKSTSEPKQKPALAKAQKADSVTAKSQKSSSKDKSASNENVEQKKQLQCEKCDYSTQLQYRLDDHMRQKHSSPPEQPSTANLHSFSSRWQSANTDYTNPYYPPGHVTLMRPAERYLTPTSVASTPQTSSRKGRRSLNCTDSGCGFIAESRGDLKKHMISQHPSMFETLKCDHCDFTTKKRPNYRQHIKTHLAPENKPYKCAQCTYSSANKEGLMIHLNSAHKGVKPYLCDTCGQSFTGISMLSKHKLMKHKPKHLSCPHCDYKTSLQTWLKDHMKRHSSDAPFTCQFCSYAAKTAGRLKVHIRIHTGERPYKCHICEYGAMEGAPLKKHLKNQHHLSVSRIDVREGKLFLTNGDIVETGLGTTTQPLPPGSFHGAKAKQGTGSGDDENTSQLAETPQVMPNAACIISQAASLSALPVQPDSPEPDGTDEGLRQFTQLLSAQMQYQLPHHSISAANEIPVTHGISISQHSDLPPPHG